MFKYKRTPILALVFGAVIAVVVFLVFEDPARPFTPVQLVLLYLLSCLPGMGFAMLLDPLPREMKAKYLKVNFYEEGNPFKGK